MFSLLDRMEGWQLIAVLAPIVLTMVVVRKREELTDSIAWSDLNSLQKGWIVLGYLSPGLGASVLARLGATEQSRIFEAGQKLKGLPNRVAGPVLDAFCQQAGLTDAPRKDPDEIMRWLQLRFEESPDELASIYRKVFF